MNNSALVAGALLAGFVLFLAARDRLTVYERVLWGAKPASHVGDTSSSSSSPANAAVAGFGATIVGGPVAGAISAAKSLFGL